MINMAEASFYTYFEYSDNVLDLLCFPPVHRTGDMLVYLCLLTVSVAICESVCPIHFCPALSMCRRSNTKRYPTIYDAEPALASIGLPCRAWLHTECVPALQTASQH